MRITSDADGKVRIGLLEIAKGRKAEKEGELRVLEALLGYEPVIDAYHVSISHTVGYVAVILSRDYEVGIDIEYVSERVGRIAARFLRNDENFTDCRQLLTAWCAKETMYKLFSSDHLGYQEMRVSPTERLMTNIRRNVTLQFRCEENQAFLLTYAWR